MCGNEPFPLAHLDSPSRPLASDSIAHPPYLIYGTETLHAKGTPGHSAAFVARRYVNDGECPALRSANARVLLYQPSLGSVERTSLEGLATAL